MDKSAVEAIVDREIAGMMNMLGGVRAWKVKVLYEPTGHPDGIAQCIRLLAYQKATIIIDPAMHDDESEVIHSLRHELIHVLLAPFDAYRDIAMASIEKGSSMDSAEERAWKMAIETCVLHVERIFDWGLAAEKPVESEEDKKKQ